MANVVEDWHEGNPLPGEAERVGEDTAVSSGSVDVDAPVVVEHPDASVAPAGSTTVDPSVRVPGITTSAGVDSGQTEHSVDYSKPAEGLEAPGSAEEVASGDSPDASHVDLSGRDLSKNDEMPSARDGVAVSLASGGGVQYSDGVCPLLASDEDVKRERESVSLGTVDVTTKQPFNVLTNAVVCPTCAKQVEGHQLVWDPTNPGVRDCAMAVAQRAHPVSKEILAASDSGDDAKAERIAKRHPLGRRILEILGLREKSDA